MSSVVPGAAATPTPSAAGTSAAASVTSAPPTNPSPPAAAAVPPPGATTPGAGALQVRTVHEDGPDGPRPCLQLRGEIDVHATPVLADLQAIEAPGGRLTLDFTGVARCNSMGLAQLLRLLEHWRGRGLQPEARGLNRTLAMLFKMTGLMRYFGGGTDNGAGAGPGVPATSTTSGTAAAPAGGSGPAGPGGGHGRPPIRPVGTSAMRRIVRPDAGTQTASPAPGIGSVAAPCAPAHAAPQATPANAEPPPESTTSAATASATASATATATASAATSTSAGAAEPEPPRRPTATAPHLDAPRLEFHVSQQNSQQLTGWYYLNTLLQRSLGRAIALTVDDLDAPGSRRAGPGATPALAFARPFDACALMDVHGYLPVARPADDCDEVSLLVRLDETRTALADFAGARTVTAHTRSFVQVLGRFFCDECGLDSAGLQMAEAGSEIGALKALLAGQADLLLMSSRGHARLSALARAGVRVLERSETGVASHLLLLHPACAELAGPLREALTGLSGHDKGRQALQDLGLSAWDVPADEEIAMLRRLYRRYAG